MGPKLAFSEDGRFLGRAKRFEKRLAGAAKDLDLNFKMCDLGLNAPRVRLKDEARFWFTEEGWSKVGTKLAADARSRGLKTRVIRKKNPKKSDIRYQDKLQLALLPDKRRTNKTS